MRCEWLKGERRGRGEGGEAAAAAAAAHLADLARLLGVHEAAVDGLELHVVVHAGVDEDLDELAVPCT